jgi:hypothetical protein
MGMSAEQWKDIYVGYLEILSRVGAGETLIKYDTIKSSFANLVRAVAVVDAKNPKLNKPRSFKNLKRLISKSLIGL